MLPLAMTIHDQIAKRIKDQLKRKRISAERLAFEIGLSPGYLYHLLAGERKAGVETLEKIAKGLGVSVRSLFPAKSKKAKSED